MADIPEYKRRHQIEPSAEPVAQANFSEPMKQVAAASRNTAAFGMKFAQNAANQRATEYAIEQANTNPGRTLLPALTDTDAQFRKVYESEERSVIEYQGSKLLRSMYEDLNKIQNPTADDLLRFEEGAQQNIGQLLEKTGTINQRDIERSLGSSFDGYYYQLANKVEASNRKYMSQQIDDRIALTSKERDDDIRNGNIDGEKQKNNALISEMLKKAYVENWSPERTKMEERKIVLGADAARSEKAYIDADEKDKPGVLKKLRENKPEHLSPTEHDALVNHLVQFSGQYDAALKGQQSIAYAGAVARLNAGQLTQNDVDKLVESNQLNAQQIADLGVRQSIANRKENDLNQLAVQMQGDFSDPVKMSKYSGSEVDAVFDRALKLVGQQVGANPDEIPLTSQAELAQVIKAPIPSMTEKLSNALRYGSAEQATDSGRAIRMLATNNPIAISKMDKDTKSLASLFDIYSRNTSRDGEQSLIDARNDVYNVDENTKIQRMNAYNDWYKDVGYNNFNKKLDSIESALNKDAGWFQKVDKGLLPSDITVSADRIAASLAERVKSPEMAWKMALDEIKETIKPTETNNRKEYMKLAPESVLPNVGYWQQNDKVRAIKEMVDLNKKMREENGFVYNELDWPDAPDVSDLLSKPLVKGDIKINVDGVPRKIVIKSDRITELSPTQVPSWSLNYIDSSGEEFPLMDLNARNAVARWRPDLAGIEGQRKQFAAKKLEEAKYNQAHRAEDYPFEDPSQVLDTAGFDYDYE